MRINSLSYLPLCIPFFNVHFVRRMHHVVSIFFLFVSFTLLPPSPLLRFRSFISSSRLLSFFHSISILSIFIIPHVSSLLPLDIGRVLTPNVSFSCLSVCFLSLTLTFPPLILFFILSLHLTCAMSHTLTRLFFYHPHTSSHLLTTHSSHYTLMHTPTHLHLINHYHYYYDYCYSDRPFPLDF